jgi:hypothetical protein
MAELEWPIGNWERDCVLRTLSGAHLLGIKQPLPEPREEIAIIIERPEQVVGFEDFEERTYEIPGVRLGVRSLRQLVQLGLAGNLAAVLPLFAPAEMTLHDTTVGEELREGRFNLLEANLPQRLLGHLEAQHRSLGSDYDPDEAMRALSLGHLGLEVLGEERLTLPVPEPRRAELAAVAAGEVGADQALGELDRIIERLRDCPVLVSDPPAEPTIQQWIVKVYREHWDRTWRPVGYE